MAHEQDCTKQIEELTKKLIEAATYTDQSGFECPLCSDINAETLIPEHYCALHLQLAHAEKDNVHKYQNIEELIKLSLTLMMLVNNYRLTLNEMMAHINRNGDLSKHSKELLNVLASELELEVKRKTAKFPINNDWLFEMDYFNKS